MQQRFAVSKQGLADALAFIDAGVGAAGLPDEIARRACVIVDELCANMMRHDPELGDDSTFELSLDRTDDTVRMVIRDGGSAFDPTRHRQRVQPKIGGHGIELIRQFTRVFTYTRQGDTNVVTIEVRPA